MLVEYNMFICTNMWYQSHLYAILLSIKFLLNPIIFVSIICSRTIEKHTDILLSIKFVLSLSLNCLDVMVCLLMCARRI
jgi:hypothetical protein